MSNANMIAGACNWRIKNRQGHFSHAYYRTMVSMAPFHRTEKISLEHRCLYSHSQNLSPCPPHSLESTLSMNGQSSDKCLTAFHQISMIRRHGKVIHQLFSIMPQNIVSSPATFFLPIFKIQLRENIAEIVSMTETFMREVRG